MLQWEREIFDGHDPIDLWRQLLDVFEGDPGPLLKACKAGDPEARERLKAKVFLVFPDYEDPEATFFAFMDWVFDLRAEYRAQVEANTPPFYGTYREVCGYWFNRHLARAEHLWAAYRALYLNRHGLPLPKECYDATTDSPEAAAERQFNESSDNFDREVVGRSLFQGR